MLPTPIRLPTPKTTRPPPPLYTTLPASFRPRARISSTFCFRRGVVVVGAGCEDEFVVGGG